MTIIPKLKSRSFPTRGRAWPRFGVDCSGLSHPLASDRAALDAALSSGIGLVDVTDFAGAGRAEALAASAVKACATAPKLVLRFGVLCDPLGRQTGVDLRPKAVSSSLAYSLARLNGAWVDIYMPAQPDPRTPIEETAAAVGEMVAAGYVGGFGLSNVCAEVIRRAHAVQPVDAVRIEEAKLGQAVAAAARREAARIGAVVLEAGLSPRGLVNSPQPIDASDGLASDMNDNRVCHLVDLRSTMTRRVACR